MAVPHRYALVSRPLSAADAADIRRAAFPLALKKVLKNSFDSAQACLRSPEL